MPRSIYSGHLTCLARSSLLALAAALYMPQGWGYDPGRLEDGIGEELQKADSHLENGAGVLEVEFTADPRGCSHGLQGIFGHRFCLALEVRRKLGKKLMVRIPYVASDERVTFGAFEFSLV